MTPNRLVPLLMCLGLASGCAQMKKAKTASQAAVVHFHEAYSAGQWDQIWDEADPRFRSSATKEKFVSLMSTVQRNLGRLVSSSNQGWNVNAGVGGKSSVRVNQDSRFERGPGREQFVFAVEGESARLLGYHIDSPNFEIK